MSLTCSVCGNESNYPSDEWAEIGGGDVCPECNFAYQQTEVELKSATDDHWFQFYRHLYDLGGSMNTEISDLYHDLAKRLFEDYTKSDSMVAHHTNQAERDAVCVLYLAMVLDPHSQFSQHTLKPNTDSSTNVVSQRYEEYVSWFTKNAEGDYTFTVHGTKPMIFTSTALDYYRELETVTEEIKELKDKRERLNSKIEGIREETVKDFVANSENNE